MNNQINSEIKKQTRVLTAQETRAVAGGAKYVSKATGNVYYRVNGVWWVEDQNTKTSHKA